METPAILFGAAKLGLRAHEGVLYRADMAEDDPAFRDIPWRPSIHMPRWACRLTLRLTDVRVQRVQEITPEDAGAEGCAIDMPRAPIAAYYGRVGKFRELWDTINAKRGYGWDANPWVWALTFEQVLGSAGSAEGSR